EGGVVKYKKNGAVFYTSTVAPGYPLRANAALYNNGATVTGAITGLPSTMPSPAPTPTPTPTPTPAPTPTGPTVVWATAPPSTVTSGQSFTVSWTRSGTVNHIHVHW